MAQKQKAEKKAKETVQPEGGKYKAGTGSFYSAAPDESGKKISTNEPFTGGPGDVGSATENVRHKKVKK